MSTLLLLVLFVLAWVVLILPKQRELRRHNALVASLEVGDEVMTGAGIYGLVTDIDGDVIHLEVAPGVVFRVARRAIASKVAVPDGIDAPVEGDGPVGVTDTAVDVDADADADIDAGTDGDDGPRGRH